MRLLLTIIATVLLLSPISSRQLTALRVSHGEDLQAAIDTAKPGDTIPLARGAKVTGNYVLRARAGDSQSFITIRTDAPGLPGAGTRTSPQWSGTLAVLQSPSNDPVLRTAPGAHHWRIENVEFGPTGAATAT